jgi:hypothetical protein
VAIKKAVSTVRKVESTVVSGGLCCIDMKLLSGSGSGKCCVACKLNKNPLLNVLLVIITSKYERGFSHLTDSRLIPTV